MTEEEINKAIARVILSTKRKSRQYSLYEIALDIDNLKKAKGGMQQVSKLIGVSAAMLSQFLSVFKLPKPIFDLVRERKIDSVSMAHNLSKFNDEDALQLSTLLSNNKLTSQDLRILIPYRKQHSKETILELVEKLNSSKNIKVSVIRINQNDTSKTLPELNSFFVNQIGSENLVAIEKHNEQIDIKIRKQGEKILRDKAKQIKITFQELITKLIS